MVIHWDDKIMCQFRLWCPAYALHQYTVYGAISLKARIHESEKQKVEMELAPFTIIPNNPLEKVLLTVLMTL